MRRLPALASALHKSEMEYIKRKTSRIRMECEREEFIYRMTIKALNNEHRTDVHRVHALIKEYEMDIKDPNVPNEVRDQLKSDLDELKKVLNQYTDR